MISNRLAIRRSGAWLSVILLALIISLWMSMAMAGDVPTTDRQPATAEQRARIVEAFGRSPLHFEPNQGQAAAGVKFVARAPGYQLYLTPNAAVLALRGKEQTSALVQMQLIGAGVNPQPVVEGVEALTGRSHYYRGNDPQRWQTDVPHFAKVRYSEVYPGVDWVLYGNPRQLEYDFVVAPGVDPKVINLSLAGADQVRLAEDGHLVAAVAGREVLHSSPTIYQVVKGERQIVEGRYVLRESVEDVPVVGFEIAAYDRNLPLVIDPVVYFTFVGGAPDDDSGVGGDDLGLSIAVDSAGNAYITGSTSTNNANVGDATKQFPTTGLAINNSFSGGTDAFVTRMDAAGTVIYSTYLGGGAFDVGYGIAVDSVGNAYVTGSTNSDNFPQTIKSTAEQVDEGDTIEITTTLPLPVARPGTAYTKTFTATDGECAPTPCTVTYAWSLSAGSLPAGFALSGAGVLSGTPTTDQVGSYNFVVKVEDNKADPKNVTRKTFTLVVAALQGTQDAFVAKINASGTLGYSTYLGGTGNESGYGIAVNTLGEAYVTGYTSSSSFPGVNFPGTTSAAANSEDAFIVKMNAVGNGLAYSRLTGFAGNDRGQGIMLDAAGTSAYITGYRNSPTNEAAFIAKINTSGVMSFNTSLDGPSNERGLAIDRDNLSPTGIYITGYTSSSSGIAFPNNNPENEDNPNAYDVTFNGPAASQDAFVAKYTDSGASFTRNYATYLGGFSNDVGYGIAVDGFGNAYVAGETFSPDFPLVAPDDNVAAKGEAFLARLDKDGTELTYSSFWGGAENDSGRGLAKDFSNDVYMVGYTNSPTDGFLLDSITPYRDYSGGADAFVTKFSIPVANTDFNTLTVTKVGTGIVTSVPTGINCGADCDQAYDAGIEVTLTAQAEGDSIFVGWAGVFCKGGDNSGKTCVVTMDEERTAIATFLDPDKFTLTVSTVGRGFVNSNPAGINCGSDCSKDYNQGEVVNFTATPAPGWKFVGWSSGKADCSGTGSCSVTMDQARNVTAIFRETSSDKRTLIVSLDQPVSGTSTVTSDPEGINCGADCQESYDKGTRVKLVAQVGADSSFDGWSGVGCSGTDTTCTVTLDNDKTVTATFSSAPTGLSLESLVSPKPATPEVKNGQRNISFELKVQNSGLVATGAFQANFYLSTDTTIGPDNDPSVGKECSFSNLAAGATASCSGNIVVPLPSDQPPSLAAGQYYLGAYVSKNITPIVAPQPFTFHLLKTTMDARGNGTVYSQPSGIACSVTTNCQMLLLDGDEVTLTQVAKTGFTFASWGQDCAGLKDCKLTMTGNRSVTSHYLADNSGKVALTVYKAGTGTVVANDPLAINCGADCWQDYAKIDNKVVTLNATPASGSSFIGWSGACTGTGNCKVTMDAFKTVTATFIDPAAATTTLITHYYESILGRAPDAAGLAFWQGLIAEKQAQGEDIKPVFRDMAFFFFNSPEYLGNNTSDTQFVTDLYRTFFQREPDAAGLEFWLGELAAGKSRNDVMADFLYSQEFTDFMEELGF